MTRVSTRCHTVKEDTNLRPLCCCCSVTQECPTLCDPMNCSTPGLPSLTISQTLPKFMAIASVIPPSHLILWWPLLLPLSSQSFPASGTFPMSSLCESNDQNTGASASASVLPLNIQGWSPSRLTGLLSNFAVNPWCPRDFQESSPAQFKGTNSLAFCLLYGPALTTVYVH